MRANCHHRSFAAILLKIYLVVGALLAQAGWGHSHEQGSVESAEHIARFHSGDFNAMQLGFHWHFGCPLETDGQIPVPHTSLLQILPYLSTERTADGLGLTLVSAFSPDLFQALKQDCLMVLPSLFQSQGWRKTHLSASHASASQAVIARLVC